MTIDKSMPLPAVYLRGMAMGAADVVPGVSGGTVALITGIYDRLLTAISSADMGLVRKLLKLDIKGAWLHVDAGFLLALLAGIVTSVLLFANLITHLLETQPLLVWSFFFGLIAASSVYLIRQLPGLNWQSFAWILFGAACAWLVSIIRPVQPELTSAYYFMCGAIAICAMVLPGVSGSFILVLLGAYAPVMGAIKGFDLGVVVVFAAGCGIGLLSFAKLLSWAMHRYVHAIMALLTGFLVGSLKMVWPWRHVVETYTSSGGELRPLVQENVLPQRFSELSGEPAQVLACVSFVALGLLMVAALEWLGHRHKPN